MGMFDYINTPKIDCPKCGEEIKSFQSKDAQCCLDTLEYYEVDHFYTSCDNCCEWICYELPDGIRAPQYIPFEKYELILKEK